MATVAEPLLTADDFLRLPDDGPLSELVRGKVVPGTFQCPQHGRICATVVGLLSAWEEERDLGHIVCNNAGIVTERNPDSVRGPDVAFFSYVRVPRGPLPASYLEVMPDVVFEVLSPTDRWREVWAKTAEYLSAGVTTVCVLDPNTQTIHVYNNDLPDRAFTADQELAIPEVLDDFRAAVRLFFE